MKYKGYEIIYYVISILNIIFSLIFNVEYLSYILFIYIIILKLNKKIINESFLMYSLFIPDKYLQLAAIPIYLYFTKRLFTSRMAKRIVFMLGYIIFFGLLNCLIYRGFVVSTLFQIGVYYCIFCMIIYFGKDFDAGVAFSIFNKMFYLQVIVAVFQIVITRKLGDHIHGTLISAHYFGVYLLLYMYMLMKIKTTSVNKPAMIIKIIILIATLIIADAKHVILVFLIAYIVSWILTKLEIRKKLTVFGVLMVVGTALALVLIRDNIGSSLFSKINMIPYIFDDNYNKKVTYFLRTLEEMKSWNGVFGFGVGQFGSQISLTMSKGVIYDWNGMLSNYTYAIEPFKRAIGGLMTEWYTNYGIAISSMVLGYPLVSFIGMVGELGVLGYIFLLNTFDSIFTGKNATFIIAFLLLTFFETYLEIPCVFVMILIATRLSQEKGKLVIH